MSSRAAKAHGGEPGDEPRASHIRQPLADVGRVYSTFQAMKDVGEYFDDAERIWEGYGCSAEAIGGTEIFEYEYNGEGKLTGKGHLLARLSLPGHPEAYLHVEDWLVPRKGHIRRESYAYDLIYQGGRLENWHYHHGQYHRHRSDGTRVPAPRVTLERAIATSLELLQQGYVRG